MWQIRKQLSMEIVPARHGSMLGCLWADTVPPNVCCSCHLLTFFRSSLALSYRRNAEETAAWRGLPCPTFGIDTCTDDINSRAYATSAAPTVCSSSTHPSSMPNAGLLVQHQPDTVLSKLGNFTTGTTLMRPMSTCSSSSCAAVPSPEAVASSKSGGVKAEHTRGHRVARSVAPVALDFVRKHYQRQRLGVVCGRKAAKTATTVASACCGFGPTIHMQTPYSHPLSQSALSSFGLRIPSATADQFFPGIRSGAAAGGTKVWVYKVS